MTTIMKFVARERECGSCAFSFFYGTDHYGRTLWEPSSGIATWRTQRRPSLWTSQPTATRKKSRCRPSNSARSWRRKRSCQARGLSTIFNVFLQEPVCQRSIGTRNASGRVRASRRASRKVRRPTLPPQNVSALEGLEMARACLFFL